MEGEERVGFFKKDISRRKFLKYSGRGIAGGVVSFSVLSMLTGCDDTAQITGFPLAAGILISDKSRCTGCQRCEIICTMNNDGKAHPHISRVKVARNYNYGAEGVTNNYEEGEGHFGNFIIEPDTCHQCEEPVPCAEACPMDAILAQEESGTRIVKEEDCVGCGACEANCPFNMITIDPEESKAKKCTLCDGDPSCAKLCPTGALKLVPWEEVNAKLKKHRFQLS